MTDVEAVELDRFRALLADLLGLCFDARDGDRLRAVLDSRAAAHGEPVAAYLARLGRAPSTRERTVLTEELTITETYFFRHAEQMRALAGAALPARVRARAQARTLRLLSVGCSSGEEAYTLAILALESVPDPGWDIRVQGIDVNSAMLRRATAGRYPQWSMRETPLPVRRRWFQQVGDDSEVVEAVRRRVSFLRRNVVDDDPVLWRPDEYDVVLCRNLLMYLHPRVAAALLVRMTGALVPGGYLFLGHTDTLGGSPAGLRVQHSHDAFYYERLPGPLPRRPAPGPAQPGLAQLDPPVAPAAPSVPACRPPAGEPAGSPARPTRTALWRDCDRLIAAERFGDALAVVAALPRPLDREEALLHAVLLAQTGDYDGAVAGCRDLLAADGLDADAHHLLGMCHEDDDAATAGAHYRRAASLDPDFALPWLRLGILARRRGDPQSGAADFQHAIALLPAERDRRILLFGGSFGRHALLALCRSELAAAGSPR
ncbi:protein-glutamate O-methyltransferase [Pilimelia terevasa]|uniref:Protein-glutamate O-methyltransferase n=1 Tax=Pilimelia terevasa TaxID=53372 RepID=A0A8J3FH34_9ACTN|nr:protein-glutamate O-methyltransferase CheR [Pilimelia terevasa]GGK24549.1 protein-glutamate O-methyltransferase [Pilimelia terevasa]